MKKRLVLAIFAGVAAIGACVGEDPSAAPSTGGLGETCVNDVCLGGLVCVDGICRVPSTSSMDGATPLTDAGTSSSDADAANDIDAEADANTDAGANPDMDANAEMDAGPDASDAGTDAGPQCTDMTTTDHLCSAAQTEGAGVEWTNPSDACNVGGTSATVSLMPASGADSSKALFLSGFNHMIPANATVGSVTVRIVISTTADATLDIAPFVLGPGDLEERRRVVSGSGVITEDFVSAAFTMTTINSGELGVHLTAGASGNFPTVSIDEVRTTIHYCTP